MNDSISRLRELLAASSPGEWSYDGMYNEIHTPDEPFLIVSECRSAPDQAIKDDMGHGFDANFALIAEMHNALPHLIRAVEAAIQLRDAEVADSYDDDDDDCESKPEPTDYIRDDAMMILLSVADVLSPLATLPEGAS